MVRVGHDMGTGMLRRGTKTYTLTRADGATLACAIHEIVQRYTMVRTDGSVSRLERYDAPHEYGAFVARWFGGHEDRAFPAGAGTTAQGVRYREEPDGRVSIFDVPRGAWVDLDGRTHAS